MSDLVLARNCCLARMLPGEAENGVGMNRSVREGKKCEALYKNDLFFYIILSHFITCSHVVYCEDCGLQNPQFQCFCFSQSVAF